MCTLLASVAHVYCQSCANYCALVWPCSRSVPGCWTIEETCEASLIGVKASETLAFGNGSCSASSSSRYHLHTPNMFAVYDHSQVRIRTVVFAEATNEKPASNASAGAALWERSAVETNEHDGDESMNSEQKEPTTQAFLSMGSAAVDSESQDPLTTDAQPLTADEESSKPAPTTSDSEDEDMETQAETQAATLSTSQSD